MGCGASKPSTLHEIVIVDLTEMNHDQEKMMLYHHLRCYGPPTNHMNATLRR